MKKLPKFIYDEEKALEVRNFLILQEVVIYIHLLIAIEIHSYGLYMFIYIFVCQKDPFRSR